MPKLTVDKIGSLLKKKVDLSTLTELKLKKQNVNDLGSFQNCIALEIVDLSDNILTLPRHIEGLFAAPVIRDLDLSGNRVCKTAGYRLLVIANMPTLEVLDGEPISSAERMDAYRAHPDRERPTGYGTDKQKSAAAAAASASVEKGAAKGKGRSAISDLLGGESIFADPEEPAADEAAAAAPSPKKRGAKEVKPKLDKNEQIIEEMKAEAKKAAKEQAAKKKAEKEEAKKKRPHDREAVQSLLDGGGAEAEWTMDAKKLTAQQTHRPKESKRKDTEGGEKHRRRRRLGGAKNNYMNTLLEGEVDTHHKRRVNAEEEAAEAAAEAAVGTSAPAQLNIAEIEGTAGDGEQPTTPAAADADAEETPVADETEEPAEPRKPKSLHDTVFDEEGEDWRGGGAKRPKAAAAGSDEEGEPKGKAPPATLPKPKPPATAPKLKAPSAGTVKPPSSLADADLRAALTYAPYAFVPTGKEACFHFLVGDPVTQVTILVTPNQCGVAVGLARAPDCVVTTEREPFIDVFTGNMTLQQAVKSGAFTADKLEPLRGFLEAFKFKADVFARFKAAGCPPKGSAKKPAPEEDEGEYSYYTESDEEEERDDEEDDDEGASAAPPAPAPAPAAPAPAPKPASAKAPPPTAPKPPAAAAKKEEDDDEGSYEEYSDEENDANAPAKMTAAFKLLQSRFQSGTGVTGDAVFRITDADMPDIDVRISEKGVTFLPFDGDASKLTLLFTTAAPHTQAAAFLNGEISPVVYGRDKQVVVKEFRKGAFVEFCRIFGRTPS